MPTKPFTVACAMLLALAMPGCSKGQGRPVPPQNLDVTKVADLAYPWRIAFLPDGRMLVTEKGGKLWLVSQDGAKVQVGGIPAVRFQGQGGLLGVYAAPGYAADRTIYLTYAEPGGRGSGLALARASLALDSPGPRLEGLEVIWRELPKGRGGQFGGAVAFSPDGKFLFLAVGDRQRMRPAQDPNLSQGKILRLTLDGKPAPGNPQEQARGAQSVQLIDPPENTEAAKAAPAVERFNWPGPNLTPAETWATGFRTPYGLAFAPDGRLWELEHGPRGGDELNLIEPGRNYGWPLVSYGVNYDGVPIPRPDTRPDLAQPVLQWTPVIGPGNMLFYNGSLFPAWRGSALLAGLVSGGLERVGISGATARKLEHIDMGFRVRDVAQAPDGSVWLLEDADPGGIYRLTPRPARPEDGSKEAGRKQP